MLIRQVTVQLRHCQLRLWWWVRPRRAATGAASRSLVVRAIRTRSEASPAAMPNAPRSQDWVEAAACRTWPSPCGVEVSQHRGERCLGGVDDQSQASEPAGSFLRCGRPTGRRPGRGSWRARGCRPEHRQPLAATQGWQTPQETSATQRRQVMPGQSHPCCGLSESACVHSQIPASNTNQTLNQPTDNQRLW